jgi:hypothetical protein
VNNFRAKQKYIKNIKLPKVLYTKEIRRIIKTKITSGKMWDIINIKMLKALFKKDIKRTSFQKLEMDIFVADYFLINETQQEKIEETCTGKRTPNQCRKGYKREKPSPLKMDAWFCSAIHKKNTT